MHRSNCNCSPLKPRDALSGKNVVVRSRNDAIQNIFARSVTWRCTSSSGHCFKRTKNEMKEELQDQSAKIAIKLFRRKSDTTREEKKKIDFVLFEETGEGGGKKATHKQQI